MEVLNPTFPRKIELMKIISKYSSSFESRNYESSEFLKPKKFLPSVNGGAVPVVKSI